MVNHKKFVVTIGSASSEVLFVVKPDKFRLGAKNTLESLKFTIGGSSLNHACRLLAMGVEVFPTLTIADDAVGNNIVKELKRAARKGKISFDFNNLYLQGDKLSTPSTTIICVGLQRTILNVFSKKLIKAFNLHLDKWLEIIKQSNKQVDSVIIGHIHADISTSKEKQGVLTKKIIGNFVSQGTNIYINFGSTQYKFGAQFWDLFLDDIKCFQLNYNEMREFFKSASLSRLKDILNWFKNKCTVIITLGEIGAIARFKNSEKIVVGWPYNLKSNEIKDTTGAGDAFMAGVVASALDIPLDNDYALLKAINNGLLWGAYSCTKFGGANQSPSKKELYNFSLKHQQIFETECIQINKAQRLLWLLDQTLM